MCRSSWPIVLKARGRCTGRTSTPTDGSACSAFWWWRGKSLRRGRGSVRMTSQCCSMTRTESGRDVAPVWRHVVEQAVIHVFDRVGHVHGRSVLRTGNGIGQSDGPLIERIQVCECLSGRRRIDAGATLLLPVDIPGARGVHFGRQVAHCLASDIRVQCFSTGNLWKKSATDQQHNDKRKTLHGPGRYAHPVKKVLISSGD